MFRCARCATRGLTAGGILCQQECPERSRPQPRATVDERVIPKEQDTPHGGANTGNRSRNGSLSLYRAFPVSSQCDRTLTNRTIHHHTAQRPAFSVCWKIMRHTLILLVRLYQTLLSPILPFNNCRFYPSCSEYAAEAIGKHGAWMGAWLAFRRLGRCHPFHKHAGFDPVP